MDLVKKKRFRELNRKLTPEEEKELTESIKRYGVKEPLTVMQGTGVLLDGFNRERIAKKLGIGFEVDYESFESEDEAEVWALRKQLGRRNLSTRDYKLLLGRLYNKTRKRPGKPGNSNGKTVSEFADEHKVSPRTVRRSSKLAESHDKLVGAAKEVSDKLSEKQIKVLAGKDKSEQEKIVSDIKNGKDPVEAIPTRAPKKRKPRVKPGTEGTTIAMLCDKIKRDHISPMSKLIKEISNINGGEGEAYKATRDGMNEVIKGLSRMRKGEK